MSITLALSLLLQAYFLGRLPLGIETTFADGSSKSWRFLRGPDASGSLEGAGGARGVLAVLKDASSWKAVAADTLGNVLALAGTNGDFTRRTFDPWGNPLTRDASGSLRAATLNERRADYDSLPLAWASQEYDPDTGLTHYHFREYSPSLGGWLTRDPIGLAGGYLNLRSYLGNRPADTLDVWGEGAPDVFHPSMPTTAAVKAEREDLRKKLQEVDGVIQRATPIIKRGWYLPSGPYMPTPEFFTPDQMECNELYGDLSRALAYRACLARLIRILDRVIDVREAEGGKFSTRDKLRDATSGMAEFAEIYNAYLLPEDGHEMTTHGLWASAELLERAGKAEFTAIEILAFGGGTTLERLIAGEGAAVVRPTVARSALGESAEVLKPAARDAAIKGVDAADDATKWIWSQNKSVAKSIRQMEQRGWVPKQITEAIKTGQQFPAINFVNKANKAIRYVHPQTGQSVVQDAVTKEIIHFGGPGFKY